MWRATTNAVAREWRAASTYLSAAIKERWPGSASSRLETPAMTVSAFPTIWPPTLRWISARRRRGAPSGTPASLRGRGLPAGRFGVFGGRRLGFDRFRGGARGGPGRGARSRSAGLDRAVEPPIDIRDQVADRRKLLQIGVGNGKIEFLFHFEHQLDGIQRIEPE